MSSSRRLPWTVEEMALLEELARENVSLQVIALKLGRSPAAVEAKASQLKVQIRRTKRPYNRRETLEQAS